MKKIKVTNNSKRTKSRLGVNLKGGESTDVTVNSRDYLVLKASKSLDVEVLEGDKKVESENEQTTKTESDEQDEENGYDFSDMNVDDTITFVKDNEVNADDAIEAEKAGKNRKSVIEQLEAMKEE